MSLQTPNYKFNLPQIGSTSEWGSLINANFTKIDTQLRIIQNNINATSSLIGANIPYVNIKDDHYFVSIIKYQDTKQIELRYFNKDKDITIEIPYINTDGHWNIEPPLYVGAYVIDSYIEENGGYASLFSEKIEDNYKGDYTGNIESNKTDGDFAVDEVIFHRGDFLVLTRQFGSVYSDNVIDIKCKKYPAIDGYFLPSVESNHYYLKFNKTNYVDWYESRNSLEFTLPSLSLAPFAYLTISFDNDSYTVKLNDKDVNKLAETADSMNPHYKESNGKIQFIFRISNPEGLNANQFYINTKTSLLTDTTDITGTKTVQEKIIAIYENITKRTRGDWANVVVTYEIDTPKLLSNETLKVELFSSNYAIEFSTAAREGEISQETSN